MKPYLYTVRNDIHIFDLEKTKKGLEKAVEAAGKLASQGGTMLFVGTKRQVRPVIQQAAESCGMPYVNVRWLGGTFTNFKTIQKTIRKMEKLQELKANGELQTRYTKKERLLIERELEKMTKLFTGIKDLRRVPEAIFIADINHDDIALAEAKKMKVKIFAIVDSNSNPEHVDVMIPANDDATQAVSLITSSVAAAFAAGRSRAATVTDKQ